MGCVYSSTSGLFSQKHVHNITKNSRTPQQLSAMSQYHSLKNTLFTKISCIFHLQIHDAWKYKRTTVILPTGQHNRSRYGVPKKDNSTGQQKIKSNYWHYVHTTNIQLRAVKCAKICSQLSIIHTQIFFLVNSTNCQNYSSGTSLTMHSR